MEEAGLPVLRQLRGISGRAPETADSGAIETQSWRSARLDAFALLDEARLLQSYRLATLILRDRDEAEDAAQEAIVRAWSSWATIRDRSRFDAWFDRILVNVCRNRLRHSRTIRMVPLADVHDFETTDSHEPSLARLALAPAFDHLSPDHRIIVVLRFWRDLSVDEIAERLGVPPGTVKSRLHYALKTLREALESTGEAGR